MATSRNVLDLEKTAAPAIREELVSEVRRGLAKRPRSLSPWMFYDERGSRLFERITELPEYYPTRTERGILTRHADSMMAAVLAGGAGALRIVELGAGVAAKTGILLDAAVRANANVVYVPVDVSPEALAVARRSIESVLPEIRTEPLVLNYVADPLKLEPFHGVTLVLYLGSSIGNFSSVEARAILSGLSRQLGAQDAFLLGADLVKDEATLIAAYDDREGVTAAFNRNILERLNRDLDADFDLAFFQHRALWNPIESRIEMHLESLDGQRVRIPAAGLDIDFVRGETIHTENSYKFTERSLAELIEGSGFAVEHTWKDDRAWFAVTLARPRS